MAGRIRAGLRGAAARLKAAGSALRTGGRPGSPFVQYATGRWAPTSSGVPMSEALALSMASVYRCIGLVSDLISSNPWRVARQLPDGGLELDRASDVAQAIDLLSADDIEHAAIAYLVGGNGFLEVTKTAAGFVERIEAIQTGRVGLELQSDGRLLYRIVGAQPSEHRYLSADQVAHPKFRCVRDPRVGESPVFTCADSLGLGAAVRAYAGRHFDQGMLPSYILGTPKGVTQKQAERLTATWKETVASLFTGGPTIALMPYDVKLEALEAGKSAQEAQLIEAAEFYVREVARIYGIPPSYLAETKERASSAVEESRQLAMSVSNTIQRFARSLEPVVFSEAQRRAGWRIQVDLSALLLGHGVELSEYWSRAVNGGLASVDEARVRLGLPRRGGAADELRAPVNTLPIDTWAEGGAESAPAPESAGAITESAEAPRIVRLDRWREAG